ncbi:MULTISPECIES: hydrogen peroxide-inducible genes activator [unclassified Oceanobacter]|jgi:LysR family hydrogen peroxide-inducible transcriptional activator|uniref:hydrogen peroxide-inducible genes activator n=1 Tax=unclassified Oceanobacter TaxID=2620260 RepID=UPI0026E2B1DD|nr:MULTISPECIES: hydrogen peroxide-inducible genes activator [unclassified Oceanobacter]MDO6683400.1 hydrogen peroxide-inducible genes activator [Oceanobacter sp. 5_MG-2023]MDP2506874.1 hydrogen peroxide-inducible genes activator [Oceanobacter sp. 3_MG-2023]MDP2547797.1 hydrogen peroxide-inducible genes activator [Oceanobacter sp. 4_MG-2023]MDP2608427.1 hydrogen peroxide-inducible genes activator [Oceanobacter sp. 1_MG-2023]MDP2611522.1 hydrogen peroxide-inducible genes activator [Oceanobacter
MTLTELKYIVTLAQEKHFGRAAEKCFVSQPTLSVAIKKLEGELDIAIFERSKSAVSITPIGERIVAQAQRVLEEARTIRELASSGKDQLSSPLKLGAIFTIGPYLFPHLVPQIHQRAPTMPLYLEENYTGVLRRQLRDGDLDAIIVALPFNEPDVLTRSLYDENFVVVLPKNHPWKSQQTIAPEQLADEDLLMLGEGHCFRDQVFEYCPVLSHKHHTRLGSVLEGSSLETLKHMVASGLGITVLPESAVNNLDLTLVITRPFTNPQPFRTVALAWRASFPRGQAVDLLLDTARQCRIG